MKKSDIISRYRLSDHAKIITSSTLLNHSEYSETNNGVDRIVIGKVINKRQVCMITKSYQKNAFYVFADDRTILGYYSFLLCSTPFIGFLTNGSDPQKKHITLKDLNSLPIIDINHLYYDCLDFISKMIVSTDGKASDKYVAYLNSFLRELRDSIVMEIYLLPLFEVIQIDIIDNWKSAYDVMMRSAVDGIISPELVISTIFGTSSSLLENMKQLRMRMVDYYKELNNKNIL